MTPATYQALAMRTANASLSQRDRLWEAAAGITAESCELLAAKTQVDRIKEIGDVCWYLASLCAVTCHPFTPIWMVPHPMPFSGDVSAKEVAINAGKLTDHLKKHLSHGHPLDLDAHMHPLAAAILGEAWYLHTEIGAIFAANVAKLRRRYPDGFSSAASMERET